MSCGRLAFWSLVSTLSLGAFALAQTNSTPTDVSGAALRTKALVLLSGGSEVHDVALTGKVRRIAGSVDETGTAVLKGLASGEMRLDMNFPSGPRNEIRASTEKGPAGSWSGPDGKPHAIMAHNLKADDVIWFSPVLMLHKLAQSSGVSVTETASTTHRGRAVLHLHIAQAADSRLPAYAIKLVEHADEMELYLDAATFLPASATFNTHPERDLGRDIPVEVRFSDYRNVNGAQVPFRVEEYLNRMLVLDLQFEAAALNTGLTAINSQ